MTTPTTYSRRDGAVRAARAACRKALNAPHYCAYEGPDYEIHPDSRGSGYLGGYRYYFRLRGPAKEAAEGNVTTTEGE